MKKKKHTNSDHNEIHLIDPENYVLSNIKFQYPNVNVINMTLAIQSFSNVISNAKKLIEYTKDDNNIIMA